MSFRRRLMMAQRSGGGGLPDGFTALEYIKCEGGYIDTGYPLQLGDVVEIDLWVKSSYDASVIYGYRWGGSARGEKFVIGTYGTYAKAFLSYIQISEERGYDSDGFINTDRRHTLRVETGDENYVYVDDVLSYSVNGTNAFDSYGSSEFNPLIFAASSLGTATTDFPIGSRCYGYEVRRNGNTVISLVPARRDYDGVNGLYDLVNRSFLISPNGVAFTSNLNEVPALYPIVSWYGNLSSGRYSSSQDGHVGMKITASGAAYVWLQDVSQNSSVGTSNINNKPKIFSISQGDEVTFKVKNITRVGGGNVALNIRTTDNGNIGVSTGNFNNTTDKVVTITASNNYDVAGGYLYWQSTTGRVMCFDIELWVNNIRYI